MNLNTFFFQHAVFTLEELDRFLAGKGSRNRHTRNSLLSYYRQQGRVISIRRGLYAVVPPGMSPDTSPIDPYLLAAKMASDAVLAYHTALAFYGNAYSTYERFYYLSGRKSAPLSFRSYEFRCVVPPRILRTKGEQMFGVNRVERSGIDVMVTSLERTFVDVLNRPDLSVSWEEIWRSLESIEYFDLDRVVEYTLLLENATTTAKVGFFLEQHRESLMVENEHLKPLLDSRPRRPHYLERGKRTAGRLVTNWNLVLPKEVLHRSWGEVL